MRWRVRRRNISFAVPRIQQAGNTGSTLSHSLLYNCTTLSDQFLPSRVQRLAEDQYRKAIQQP